MKKFKFSLQVLLNVRSKEEKSVKGELYNARLRLSQLQDQLSDMKSKAEMEQGNFKENMNRGMTAQQIQIYYSYLDKLDQVIKKQIDLIYSSQKECDNILSKLIEIRKTVKMLETLKQQRYQEYLKEAELEENKLIDDYINSRSILKHN